VPLQALDDRLKIHAADTSRAAILTTKQALTYGDLLDLVEECESQLVTAGVGAGDPILISSSFEPQGIACFLALLRLDAVAVLCSPEDPNIDAKVRSSQARAHLPNGDPKVLIDEPLSDRASKRHPLLTKLCERSHPGFVVFSSGSTGEPKAVLHDAEGFCAHLKSVTKALSTVAFLAFDHIAGVDTLLYTLFAGGNLVVPESRSPGAVCQAIEQHRAQVLPVSPSFLKLLLVSPALQRADLDSLEIVTFGSEPPDATVTQRLAERLPNAQLMQKYGTSEFGAPRSKTRPGDSSWIKLESENFSVQIVDDILWVKASGTMLGYLNAELDQADNVLSKDGWFCTGDRVEQDGEWLRILGRDSDMINVGGEKVFPAEVESVVEGLPEVLECAVHGEEHPLMGNMVVARVRLQEELTGAQLKRLVRNHCKGKLPRHAIPVKVTIVEEPLTSDRGKRLRG